MLQAQETRDRGSDDNPAERVRCVINLMRTCVRTTVYSRLCIHQSV